MTIPYANLMGYCIDGDRPLSCFDPRWTGRPELHFRFWRRSVWECGVWMPVASMARRFAGTFADQGPCHLVAAANETRPRNAAVLPCIVDG